MTPFFEARFWRQVERSDPDWCWEWQGALSERGYGRCSARTWTAKGSHTEIAHRVAYELLVGPIPAGLHLDHLCFNTRCVNPKHMEPVTNAENMARAKRHRATCRSGRHPFPESRTSEGRCRECRREWERNRPPRVDPRVGGHRRKAA